MRRLLTAAILMFIAPNAVSVFAAEITDPPPDDPEAVAALQRLGAGLVFDAAGHAASLAIPPDRAADALKHLWGVPQLLVLDLSDSNVRDRDLKHLSATEALQSLRLRDTAITDRGLKHIARLHALAHLDLTRTRVSDAGLKRLTDLTKLRRLVLKGTRVEGAFAEELGHLKQLTYVDVTDTNVHETALQALQQSNPTMAMACPTDDERVLRLLRDRQAAFTLHDDGRLRTISFSQGQWDDTMAVAVSRLDHLRAVYLNDCSVTDDQIPHIAKARSLNSLWLQGNPITDTGALHLAALDRLFVLKLENTKVSEDCRTHLYDRINRRLTASRDDERPPQMRLHRTRDNPQRAAMQDRYSRRLVDPRDDEGGPQMRSQWWRDSLEGNATVPGSARKEPEERGAKTSDNERATPAQEDAPAGDTARTGNVQKAPARNEAADAVARVDHIGDLERLIARDRELGPVARPIKARRLGFHIEEFRFEGKNRIGVVGSGATDEQLKVIAQIADLTWLALPDSNITDQGLAALSGAASLRELNLESEHITGKGLSAIDGPQGLVYVTLNCPQVGDRGFDFLKRQQKLEALYLRSNRITDAGFSKLASLRQLKYVHVCSTSITKEGRQTLHDYLPQVAIAPSRDFFIGSPHLLHEPAKTANDP